MDRASDSGSEGWGFESLPVYQIKEEDTRRVSSSFISPSGREGTRTIKCGADERRSRGLDRATLYDVPGGNIGNESLPAYGETLP